MANASAGEEEIKMATNGVEVNHEGQVVAASRASPLKGSSANSQGTKQMANGKMTRDSDDGSTPPRDRMNISLHNFGDYTQDTQG